MAKIVRFCVLEEEHIGDNVFLCHRPFVFGNPYIVNKESKFKGLIKTKSLEECLMLYGHYFDRSIVENETFKNEWERLIDAYYKYDTIYIGCYCRLDKACHTDYIIKKLQQYVLKNKVKELLKNKR